MGQSQGGRHRQEQDHKGDFYPRPPRSSLPSAQKETQPPITCRTRQRRRAASFSIGSPPTVRSSSASIYLIRAWGSSSARTALIASLPPLSSLAQPAVL